MTFNNKVIRLRKVGHTHYPLFDIVIISNNSRNRGRFIEKLGCLNPNFNNRILLINSNRLAFWVSNGVKVNKTVKKYVIKFLINR